MTRLREIETCWPTMSSMLAGAWRAANDILNSADEHAQTSVPEHGYRHCPRPGQGRGSTAARKEGTTPRRGGRGPWKPRAEPSNAGPIVSAGTKDRRPRDWASTAAISSACTRAARLTRIPQLRRAFLVNDRTAGCLGYRTIFGRRLSPILSSS